MEEKLPTRLETLKKRLSLYLKAEEAILSGAQSYSIGSRNLTRANLAEIRKMIDNLYSDIADEEALTKGRSRRRAVGVLFRDW